MFSDLRRDLSKCPVGEKITGQGILTEYDLWNLTSGLANNDILKVGRFVVCHALANCEVAIKASKNLVLLDSDNGHLYDGHLSEARNDTKKWANLWVRWWRNCIDTEHTLDGGDWQANKGIGRTIRNSEKTGNDD